MAVSMNKFSDVHMRSLQVAVNMNTPAGNLYDAHGHQHEHISISKCNPYDIQRGKISLNFSDAHTRSCMPELVHHARDVCAVFLLCAY
jgi:hypothetical protein